MKVTKREQMLLGALLIMLLGYGFYKFVYIKQNQKISELKTNRDNYSQKWEQVKAKIASKDKKNEQYKILNSKIISKTDKLFPSIEQEEIIMVLDKIIKDSNLKADVLGFSEISSENTTEDKSKAVATTPNDKTTTNQLDTLVSEFNGISKNDVVSEKTTDSKAEVNTAKATTKVDGSKATGAYKMQVTLNFKSTYEELVKFLGQVENYEKKIITSNVNLAAGEGSNVSGNIILEFYGIPKLIDNDDFKWDYKVPSGKGNPFVGGSAPSVIAVNPNANANKTKAIIYDFLMGVSPTSSDLPTIMLGKAKDSSRNTYVYADNEGEENIEIYLTQNGDKYFYKYKTTQYTYPKDFNTQQEFTPYGQDIKLKIYSHKRNSGADLSGANIKLFNKTDLTVNVDIEDDDKDKPRVKISKETENINVSKL